MLIKIYPQNPNQKNIDYVVDILRSDGLIIYPTDGVYAFGCSLKNAKAFERLKKITGKDGDDFSIMCSDLSHISDYAKVDTSQFKILKRNLPGPFTFIMRASSKVPDKVLAKRKTIGIRIAGNAIPIEIVKELDVPLLTASVKIDDEIIEYATDPELIHEQWGDRVDLVIDGGFGQITPTTLVDLTGDDPEILREGGGTLSL